MIRSQIDVADPAGKYTTPDGRTLYKFQVTTKDGTDGLAFAEVKRPWWLTDPGAIYYEITKVVNGTNHIRIRRTDGEIRRPGQMAGNRVKWEWALALAAQVVPRPIGPASAAYYGELETTARQLHLTLDRLKQTT